MGWPDKLNIAGIEYPVEYVALDQEVDRDVAECAQGQIVYCPRAIRILVGKQVRKRGSDDILETILHELLHGIFEAAPMLAREVFGSKTEEEKEPILTELCRLLHDTLGRNKLLRVPKGRPRITERS
jgi:hypothetical protein